MILEGNKGVSIAVIVIVAVIITVQIVGVDLVMNWCNLFGGIPNFRHILFKYNLVVSDGRAFGFF